MHSPTHLDLLSWGKWTLGARAVVIRDGISTTVAVSESYIGIFADADW